MPLKLMYITNNADVAKIAQKAGVDRIFVDLEFVGKELRQPGDTVKSSHSIADVINMRKILGKSKLVVRVNPISEPSAVFCGSKKEIDDVIAAGADLVMLPMAKSLEEIQTFLSYVNGRAQTILLLETAEAVADLDHILSIGGFDEVHIGLNDLHLAYKKKFMFELLTDGTVERLCNKFRVAGVPYGFGGIARIGHGMLPAEYVIGEHYRLGSGAAILSRSFCDIKNTTDLNEVERLFVEGVGKIRVHEKKTECFTPDEFMINQKTTKELVQAICRNIGG
ncbi:MAG: aldolase [Clostridia bacterium]|nr:aldolase [Clostridia bacterium]